MLKSNVLAITLISILVGAQAYAGDVSLPEIPSHLPNPLKKAAFTPVDYTKDLAKMEAILYGEANEGKSDEGRVGALERTVFGASSTKYKLSTKMRIEGLARVVNHLTDGRKQFEAKQWSSAKTEFEEVLRLMGKEYKSTAKAEVYYRLGMCEYELSNIRVASAQNPAVKINGALIRSSKDNLTKAQDYYKSLGQLETSQKISSFIDTFRDKAMTYFLY